MTSRISRISGLLLPLLVMTACGVTADVDQPEPETSSSSVQVTSPATSPASLEPAPSASAPNATCFSDQVAAAACGFVHAVQHSDPGDLGEVELEVAAGAVGSMPVGGVVIEDCELVGDISTDCAVTVGGAAFCAGIQPLLGEYSDGEVILEDGVEQRYGVISWSLGDCTLP